MALWWSGSADLIILDARSVLWVIFTLAENCFGCCVSEWAFTWSEGLLGACRTNAHPWPEGLLVNPADSSYDEEQLTESKLLNPP